MYQDFIVLDIYVTLAFLLLIILISARALHKLLLYREQMFSELRLKLLRRQMEPHFLGNMFQSLQGLLYRGKKEQISEALHEYANLMKSNFEMMNQEMVPLEQEIKMLMQFIQARNLLSEVQINYELRINFQSKAGALLIPSMLLQPVVENALEHGLAGNPNPRLILEFQISNRVRIRIINNGKDFEEPKVQQRKGSLEVTRERLHLLSMLSKESYSLEFIRELAPYQIKQGCIVEINIPSIKTT